MYLLKSVAVLTAIMTIAASSWYIAINITTPSDVTAIYNCSAFFAYAFSVVLLREKVTKLKSFSVILAIIGVMVVAYGDSLMRPLSLLHGASVDAADAESNRLLGNIIIGIGAVLYGLYEVVYKRYLCPPKSVSARRSALFANIVGATVGIVSFFTVWILLPILSYFDLESFELPTGDVLFYLIISIIANMLFSGSFLILMSLTSPVLSSVAALLTIFLVAITDWLIFGTPLTPGSVLGGGIIGFAFILLAGASWREIGAYDEEPLTITDEEIARAEADRQRLLRQNDRWLARENNVESAAGEA
ncbi:hypothetical protein BZA70DRAFT_284008 [Myxozyma melibiosi]|uniref:EamA domain-containing protein n=1 Tax=Myxozyma melibiosi TaxID=54550 RepID=A0ABR1EZZ8_9ASCO